jgi:putative addiction module component (TIGR02574 family)
MRINLIPFEKPHSPRRICVYSASDMSIEQIAAEALKLPARDRAQLAGSLWESLDDPSEATDQMDDAAAVALAQARDRQMESGEVRGIPHREMMTKLRR